MFGSLQDDTVRSRSIFVFGRGQSSRNVTKRGYDTTPRLSPSVLNLTSAMNSALQLQLATASYIVIHYQILKKKTRRKSPRWWVSKLYQSRKIYSGSSLLADLKFQHISGLYKNFTRMHPISDFEFLLNSIGPSISRQDTRFRESIPAQERLALTLRFLSTGDSYVSLQYMFKISKHTQTTNKRMSNATAKIHDTYILVPTCFSA